MESYFYDTQKGRIKNRFFFIFGKTSDTFCENNYIEYSFENVLYNHLKELGYRRIIFYSRENKKRIYCYDDDEFALIDDLESKTTTRKKTVTQHMRGPVQAPVTRIKMDDDSSPAINIKEPKKNLCIMGDDRSLFTRINSCMKNDDKIKTAVIFPEAECLINGFGAKDNIRSEIFDEFERYKRLKNDNIMIFIFPERTYDKLMEVYKHREEYWKIFFEPLLKINEESESANNETANNTAVIDIESPAIGEIRNAINYIRLKHNMKVDFLEFEEILKKIAKYNGKKKEPLRDFIQTLKEKFVQDGKVLNKKNFNEVFSEKDEKTAQEKLNELVGMESVKNEINKIRAAANKESKNQKIALDTAFRSRILPPVIIKDDPKDNKIKYLHRVITGNPGTGKTTFAKLLGEIYYELGYLSSGHCVVIESAEELMKSHVGESAEETRKMIKKAMGGVLFIDEAYTLAEKTDVGGQVANEIIATLVSAMSANNGRFAVVAAGYTNEMQKFYKANSGFPRRFGKQIEINDYKPNELREIFEKFLIPYSATPNKELAAMLDTFFYNLYHTRDKSEWGNAGSIEEIVEQIYKNYCVRTENMEDEEAIVFTPDDIPEDYRQHLVKSIHQEFIFDRIRIEKLKETENSNETISDSLLLIKTISNDGSEGFGSGFLITADGYIITCYHVIENAKEISVRDERRTWANATVIKLNKDIDIALLKIQGLKHPTLKLQRPDAKNNEREHIYLFGFPFGSLINDNIDSLNASYFEGYISSFQKIKNIDVIFIGGEAKRGNSGGCVLSKNTDEVIGILQGSKTFRDEEINHFIPIKYVWQEFIAYKN